MPRPSKRPTEQREQAVHRTTLGNLISDDDVIIVNGPGGPVATTFGRHQANLQAKASNVDDVQTDIDRLTENQDDSTDESDS